jgi:hypothetical protein
VALVDQAPRPPMVTVALPDEQVQAALLVWARADTEDWRAGVCYIYSNWHTKALVTTWAPAVRVKPHRIQKYHTVPVVLLGGDPSEWPALPPRYPGADERWLAMHQHLVFGASPR